jgi:hypothetical protein
MVLMFTCTELNLVTPQTLQLTALMMEAVRTPEKAVYFYRDYKALYFRTL